MAKKDGKKGDAKKGARIPKEIGGIKIPKDLRKKGEALIDQANSPAGRQAITVALTMAATVATAAIAKKAAEKHEAKPASDKETAHDKNGGTQKAPDPQAVVDAIGNAAEAMLGRFFGKRV